MSLLLSAVVVSAATGQTRGGFDAGGHLLMNGVPRFVLGVYDSGGAYSSDPAHWEGQIFAPAGRGLQGFPLNVYLNYWLGGMPIGPTTALLDVLHGHGMMYLQTGNCFDDGSWTRYGAGSFSLMSESYVRQFAQHPAALGYYIMDECVDALIAETEAHRAQLASWDPQGITFAATVAAGYRDPSLWTGAADVLGTDPYPLYGPERAAGYTHFIVGDFVSKLRAAAEANRPVWSVLQFFKFTTDSRMPTPEELRAHAVMSIVEGAQGIFWWDIGVNGLRRLDAATVSTYMGHLKTLTTEIAGLEPALIAGAANAALVGNSTRFADPVAGRIAQLQHNSEVEWLYSREGQLSRIQWYQAELAALQAGDTSKSGGMLIGAANVRTLTKVVNGVGYVFAYNYTNASRPATFTWQRAPTGVRESKTGQTFPVSGSSWTDTFAPYQARIYVVSGAGATPPPLALSFTNPGSGTTVSGAATVTLSATGGTGYTFTVTVVGNPVYTGTNPTFSWNTTTAANGSTSLAASVTDSQSRTATATRTVTVSNAATTPGPGSLGQFMDDGVTTVPVGGTADARTVVLKGVVADPEGDTVKLQVEVRPLGGAFTNTATHESIFVGSGGQALVTVSGLTNGVAYHWQARTVESEGAASGWVAFAGNPDTAADFTVSVVTFVDVGSSEGFWLWIEALFRAGITGGCRTTPPAFCPDEQLSRAEMAVFLLRGIHGAGYAPPAASGSLADVPASHPFAAWIERLFAEGITGGCGTNPLRYCPDQSVTRGQMAVFLLRSTHGAGYQPEAAPATFADVPLDHPFARWIGQLFREAVTAGCAVDPARYCPDQLVTRAEMSVFLVRAFGLPM